MKKSIFFSLVTLWLTVQWKLVKIVEVMSRSRRAKPTTVCSWRAFWLVYFSASAFLLQLSNFHKTVNKIIKDWVIHGEEKKQKRSDSCNSASVEPMIGLTTLVFLFSLGLKHYVDSNHYHLNHNSNIHPVCCNYVYVKMCKLKL